jgi:hypothetical protein
MIEKIDLIYTNTEISKTKIDALDKRINGSINDIEKHIERGSAWRIAIVCSAVGWIIALAIQVAGFCYMWGQLTKMVEINTGRISAIEILHPRITK